MSRRDAVVIASRTLGTLLGVWAFSELCYLPEVVQSFFHYMNHEPASASVEYFRHYYLLRLGFNITGWPGFPCWRDGCTKADLKSRNSYYRLALVNPRAESDLLTKKVFQ
jgi:hypothetical protein